MPLSQQGETECSARESDGAREVRTSKAQPQHIARPIQAQARMSGPPRGYPYGYAPPGYYAAPPGYVLAPPPAYAPPPPPRVVVRQTPQSTVVHVPPPRPSGDPMRQRLEKEGTGRAFFWTQDEEQNLRALVGALGTSQWATVAERLGTKRSAAAVEQRWREHHARLQGSRPPAPRVIVRGATSTPARWSAGEDALLKQLVNENGIGKWELISRRLGTNRHPQDVERRWRESFNTAPRSAPRRRQSQMTVPTVDGVLQAGLDVARGDFDVAKPTRGTDTDANKLAHVLIRLEDALTNLAKDSHALLVRREEAVKKKLECIKNLEEAAQCQKAELILAQSRVNEEGGQAVLDAVDAHWARVYRSHDRRLQAARADLARVEEALVDAMGKMEGGGKVGSKAVLLLPKPAPAPRSQPPAKRARSDDVVFPGSRAAAV